MASSEPKRVLFVCSHNSNRSIAAEAIARKQRPDLYVASAGVDAAGIINPKMVEALHSRGFTTDGLRSKMISDPEIGGLNNKWDYIIMMGCLAGLPDGPPPGSVVENWGLPDPASEPHLLNQAIDSIVEKVKTVATGPPKTAEASHADFVTGFSTGNKIAMFSKTFCPFCKKVKAIFQEIGVVPSVVELDIREDGAPLQAALAKITGRNTVPQVFIGGKFIGGCDDVTALYQSGELVKLVK